MAGGWQIAIDRGGTFTDCVGVSPSGEVGVVKVLSSDHAPLEGIRRLMGLGEGEPIPPCEVRLGTTLATNALLERRGKRTALAITRGFGDLLEIGTQARPELFALRIDKLPPLPESVLELDARLDAHGRVLTRPDEAALESELGRLRASGVESLAVVVIHSYLNPELELQVGAVAARVGFEHVALSHRVSPERGLLARTDTTLLDAYLTPLLGSHLSELAAALRGSTLLCMQSSGGLVDAAGLTGPHAILSGPAGGLVALGDTARRAGVSRAVGLDMGGTSTDVSRWAGELPLDYETEIAGVRVRAPMMSVHTIAAGGGSECRVEGARLTVGPESAGAHPGPLCYGDPAARELTLTDVNLLLGRLPPDRFPFPLERARAEQKLGELAAQLTTAGTLLAPLELGEGFVQVADSAMAEAIRRVSIARGHDVRDHALVVFGGAGGQHACGVARRLGIRRLLFHPLSGVLSAVGIGLADRVSHAERDAQSLLLDQQSLGALAPTFIELEAVARTELESGGYVPGDVRVSRRLDLRYAGSEARLTLDVAERADLESSFHDAHRQAFGYARPGHPIELACARVELRAPSGGFAARAPSPTSVRQEPFRRARLFHGGRWLEDVPCHLREALGPSAALHGPALVLEQTGTIFLEPGFTLRVLAEGLLDVRDTAEEARRPELSRGGAVVDPVLLEIMGSLYMSIAEQMGEALRRTAFSTNIRERLDFSCAVFDAEGGLVANAPHIPVHLGAMSESVRAVRKAHPRMNPGDVFVTNDPFAGGSHLPDITVVSPVHDAGGELAFYTACRGHHADVGGITPGSMPAFSRSIAEEGVVLSALPLVKGGVLERDAVLRALKSGPYPARDPDANLRDLEAQIAANATGARLLAELTLHYGLPLVRAYMGHVQGDAQARVERQIERIGDGDHRFADALDDGTPIVVNLKVQGRRMQVDFTGTGAEVDGNLNAPRAVTLAAVLYFLRTLVGAKIPLNGGCLRPVELRIPPGSVLCPSPGRAVCGGNVETSQRVVDVLFGAVGALAASQGSMNNLTFGGDGFTYYETIAGGAGAGPDFDGASAVHTHMTNTRITDAEVLESRFPVRLERFAVRRGSGGGGSHRGGDGVVRELTFLAPVELAIVSERRTLPPFGLGGGEPGARGVNRLDGRDIGGRVSQRVAAGARLRIETPGGGGYGAK
ncbi:MAG: hydantoinase B/oxoprolinase family protein [Polyangiaceae bacterium]|nr:hydantoinase B/oxoprolinase family protein [Polyangiaceae bacterium]